VSDKVEFLRNLNIFRELDDEALEALAYITDEYEFGRGAVIAYQRDVADKLYIVRSGRLISEVYEGKILRDSPYTRHYHPKDFFQDVWLFSPRTHPATIRGGDDGRLLIIEQSSFLEYLAEFADIIPLLKLSDEAREEADKIQVAHPDDRRIRTLKLLPEEIIEFNERRSVLYLGFQIFWPLLLLVLAMLALWALTRFASSGANIAAAVLLVAGGLYVAFKVLDWLNDYFVITNKHLVHREFHLRRLSSHVVKVPLDQVQSVEVLKPNLLANLLNVGAARVTTASVTGVILFDYIDDPKEVEAILDRLRGRVLAMDYGRTQATMRATVEDHFQAKTPLVKVVDPEEEDDYEEEQDRPSLLQRLYRATQYRVEEGPVITYRKHFFTLVGHTWWVALLSLGFSLGGLFLISRNILSGLLILGWLLLLAVLGFWLIWRFEDWRNDIFQVTDRYVLDIDRMPFGFGESRKQAELANVQNITANRPGLLATIFNFGEVFIETAGASADITFERVADPYQIQSDLFKRREAVRSRQLFQEGEQRRKEYSVLLDVYQQAQEQGRLPRRTPP
jgi:uncharacterized membrane protein YdbT with pleckstrin-like domain/CRP-like cAMP-binding protein